MKLKTLVEILEHKQVRSLNGLRRLGIPARFIDTGAFRKVFGVRGLNVVIKVPHTPSYKYHIDSEMKAFDRIKSDPMSKILRQHIPKIHYYNKRTRLMVVEKYKFFPTNRSLNITEKKKLSRLYTKVKKVFGTTEDLCIYNVGYDGKKFILTDMGLFGYDI